MTSQIAILRRITNTHTLTVVDNMLVHDHKLSNPFMKVNFSFAGSLAEPLDLALRPMLVEMHRNTNDLFDISTGPLEMCVVKFPIQHTRVAVGDILSCKKHDAICYMQIEKELES